ncbi:MAG: glycoside hydrolase family 13 protein [Flammeovirgaceae bacterium]
MKRLPFLVFLLPMLFIGMHQAQAKVSLERVEPAFWWAGMKNPKLQLLVYGENISTLRPSLAYAGVQIEQVIQVKSPNYLFIDLHLSSDVKPGRFKIDFLDGEKSKLSYTYQLFEREAGSAEREGFNSTDVMYLITPDRFANGDPSNDQLEGFPDTAGRSEPGGRHGGDIAGIENSLDYIADMGFTAIWVNPVLENNMPAYSYHGYATTDFYQVDARFGTNEAYKELGKKAKAKGIKLIMDMIVNHCGSAHWWMKDLPTDNWLNYQENFTPTNHRRSVIQDPYAAAIDTKGFADGWFVETMPDLNQRNPLMANYLTQNAIWWIEYAGLAGIRMDTYPYPDKDYMTVWTQRVMEEYPDFNVVGEEWSENPAIVAHWQRGKVNPNGYTSELRSLMDFPIQATLVRALNAEEKRYGSGFIQLYEMLANDFLYADPYELVVFPDNHDMSRIFTQVNEDFELYKMAIAYLLTVRGTPQIYYGTEILMKNPGTTDHGIIRSDFPGGWKGDEVNAFTGKGLTAQQKEAKAFMQKLLNWRKTASAVHTGKLMHFAPENGIYVLMRYDEKQKVMLIMNKGAEQELDLSRFQEGLGTATKGKDVITDTSYSMSAGTIKLNAKSVLVLELE